MSAEPKGRRRPLRRPPRSMHDALKWIANQAEADLQACEEGDLTEREREQIVAALNWIDRVCD